MNIFRASLALPFVLLGTEFTSAASLPEPLSYAKPTPGGRFVLIVFGSAEAEGKLKGETKTYVDGVRAKYPQPGMYRAGDSAELVYALVGYAPDDNVYLTEDGRSVIRIEGDWWRTKAYPQGQRLSAETERKQLDAPAVSFFEDGRLLKTHMLRDIISEPEMLSHSPEHILWVGGAAFREDKMEFLLFTQDARRVTFDVRTGEIRHVEKMGYGNLFGQRVILVTLGLTVVILAIWAWLALVRRPWREPAHSPSPPPMQPLG